MPPIRRPVSSRQRFPNPHISPGFYCGRRIAATRLHQKVAFRKPRRGARFIAWGVSPRTETSNPGSPEGATDCGCSVSLSLCPPIVCRRCAARRRKQSVDNASSAPPLRTQQYAHRDSLATRGGEICGLTGAGCARSWCNRVFDLIRSSSSWRQTTQAILNTGEPASRVLLRSARVFSV